MTFNYLLKLPLVGGINALVIREEVLKEKESDEKVSSICPLNMKPTACGLIEQTGYARRTKDRCLEYQAKLIIKVKMIVLTTNQFLPHIGLIALFLTMENLLKSLQ